LLSLLSVAFPLYNEEENVGPLLDEALTALPSMARSFEIVAVDDGSVDTTADIVRSYSEQHPQVRLVAHPQNLGYGHALRTGLLHAKGDAVALIDGDRQFHMDDLGKLVALIDDNDVVYGYRIKRADPPHRLLIAGVYHRVLRAAFKVPVKDVDCGMKLFRREVIDAVAPELESRSAFISPELVIRADRAGFRIAEVGVPHHPRVAGRSKGATPRVVARTIGEIARLRRHIGRSSPTQQQRSA
jgi:dolichol-phosphate mannosyltransferase